MTKNEYLLSCLSEEASEVIKDVSKSLRFGMDSSYPGSSVQNRDRIREELIDLIAVAEMLVEHGIIDDFQDPESLYEKEEKKEKVLKYLKISKSLGAVQ